MKEPADPNGDQKDDIMEALEAAGALPEEAGEDTGPVDDLLSRVDSQITPHTTDE
jgi:hypothetical protein